MLKLSLMVFSCLSNENKKMHLYQRLDVAASNNNNLIKIEKYSSKGYKT